MRTIVNGVTKTKAVTSFQTPRPRERSRPSVIDRQALPLPPPPPLPQQTRLITDLRTRGEPRSRSPRATDCTWRRRSRRDLTRSAKPRPLARAWRAASSLGRSSLRTSPTTRESWLSRTSLWTSPRIKS